MPLIRRLTVELSAELSKRCEPAFQEHGIKTVVEEGLGLYLKAKEKK